MRRRIGFLMLLPVVAALGANPWVYEKTRVLPELSGANIETEVYNTSGGTVDLLVSGNMYDLCKGGYERL